MMPTTKAGSVDTAEHTAVTPRSNQPPRRMAATVPAVPPMRTARMTARIAIDRSTGRRWAMLCETGIWVKYDRPRLPWTACTSQFQYCTISGWSRPRYLSRRATAAGVAASWPRIVAAGLLFDSAPRQ